jgi:hypothetical protein
MDLRLGYDAMIVFVLAFVLCATNPVQAADIPGKPEGTLTTAMAPWCRNGIVSISKPTSKQASLELQEFTVLYSVPDASSGRGVGAPSSSQALILCTAAYRVIVTTAGIRMCE